MFGFFQKCKIKQKSVGLYYYLIAKNVDHKLLNIANKKLSI